MNYNWMWTKVDEVMEIVTGVWRVHMQLVRTRGKAMEHGKGVLTTGEGQLEGDALGENIPGHPGEISRETLYNGQRLEGIRTHRYEV